MSCPNYKRLCERLIISESVTFADDILTINLPAGNYADCEKYCIVVAQALPETTTIVAPVVITIGDDTTAYPLLNCDCTSIYAYSINTRTRYSVKVNTGLQDGAFVMIGKVPCSRCANRPASLPLPTEAAPAG